MRSPTTAGVEKPEPMSVAFHCNLGPSLGHSFSRPVSVETPFRWGPRHWGQSSAWRHAGSAKAPRAKATRAMMTNEPGPWVGRNDFMRCFSRFADAGTLEFYFGVW